MQLGWAIAATLILLCSAETNIVTIANRRNERVSEKIERKFIVPVIINLQDSVNDDDKSRLQSAFDNIFRQLEQTSCLEFDRVSLNSSNDNTRQQSSSRPLYYVRINTTGDMQILTNMTLNYDSCYAECDQPNVLIQRPSIQWIAATETFHVHLRRDLMHTLMDLLISSVSPKKEYRRDDKEEGLLYRQLFKTFSCQCTLNGEPTTTTAAPCNEQICASSGCVTTASSEKFNASLCWLHCDDKSTASSNYPRTLSSLLLPLLSSLYC